MMMIHSAELKSEYKQMKTIFYIKITNFNIKKEKLFPIKSQLNEGGRLCHRYH